MSDLDKITNQFIVEGTLEHPFKFYEDLIFYDSFDKVLKSFYTQTNITKDYRLIVERNNNFYYEAWHGKDDLSDVIDYKGHFIKVLKYSTKIAFRLLEDKLKHITEIDKKTFISSQLNLLVSCLDKINAKTESNLYEFVEQEILNIISDIRIKYSNLISSHKAFVRVSMNSNNIDSIFQPKPQLKRQFFVDLYNVTIELDLIDDIEVQEDVFLDVFTSKTPQHESKIVFIKINPIVAHFLKEIEPFFNNFNAVTIEKSQCFFNKQNKLLKSTDLYTALSRGKDSHYDFFRKIDVQIAQLKSAYLS